MFLFFTQLAVGQLSDFTLTVTKTDETCTANGTLSFSVSDTTSGATILYSIFLLPNTTTPISVQSATTLSGLSSGNYRVVATQSLGNETNTQQQDIIIDDHRVELTFIIASNVLPEVCGNDGKITVTVTHGTAVSYEIFSGPMIRPQQTSNVFDNLTAGTYQIWVFDNCGEAVVQTYTLTRLNSALNLTLYSPQGATCTNINVWFGVATATPYPNGVVKYPLNVVTTVYPPSGGTSVVLNQIVFTGPAFSITQSIPFYANQPYNYTIRLTDGCGTSYTLNGVINNITIANYSSSLSPQGCLYKTANFSNIIALSLISAPATYQGSVPQSILVNSQHAASVPNLTAGTYVFSLTDLCGVTHQITLEVAIDQITPLPNITISNRTCSSSSLNVYNIHNLVMVSGPSSVPYPLPHEYWVNPNNGSTLANLPVGNYVFTVNDICGNPSTITVEIIPVSFAPRAYVLEGCENGQGSLQLQGDFETVMVTAAPSAYNFTLPHDVSAGIIANNTKISLDSLPPGNYIIQSTDNCNVSYTTNVNILGFQSNTNATIIPNCGSFNLNLNHTSNNNSGSYSYNDAEYWLQKYNPITNSWGHPQIGSTYTEGAVPNSSTAVYLTNNAMNYNLAYTGHFRILKAFAVYSYGNINTTNCVKVIHEFDLSQQPRIIDVITISCNSTFEVIVQAEGNSTLTYRIISKNGQPFLIDNGTSNVFSGLESASYVFQVEDTCGNRLNSEHQILNPNPIAITASPVPCNGGSFSLTVPNFPFLTYEWWKGNATTAVLSSTNVLNFPTFNPTSDNGLYHVRITYIGNPNSCLNQTLDYVINVSANDNPNAGDDNTRSYCGRQGVINLTALLSGTFDSGGVWTEVTSSGMLANNLWDSSAAPYGNYQFKYTVVGNCSQADDATIDIEIKEIPQVPVASADPIICVGGNVNLYATSVANGAYHWVGPNSFASSDQNPVLNAIVASANGTYTVYSSYNGCQSGDSSVEVFVNPLPEFTLNQDCVNREYQVWAIKTNEASYNENLSVFSWTGPNSFSSSQNPIQISGGVTGIYSLTITNEFGCQATNSIDVTRTHCFVPNVITPNNDDTNESLDLTGFDVIKLEIYSRWGRKVYEKNNYINEWHGQNMNGDRLPDSTYYYLIELPDEGTKVGWIFVNGSR